MMAELEMTEWKATIPGPPIGKGRPRTAIRNGFVRTYTPKPTAQWEAVAAATLMSRWDGAPLDVPVSVGIVALFPRPQRMIWKQKPMLREPYCQKPDIDNMAKAVLDALEKGGIIRDDKAVWSLDCIALYCSGDESPSVGVRVGW
jgi:Holliday junction resolvase RusA-like endonuclease